MTYTLDFVSKYLVDLIIFSVTAIDPVTKKNRGKVDSDSCKCGFSCLEGVFDVFQSNRRENG